jgi:hypothetical protein
MRRLKRFIKDFFFKIIDYLISISFIDLDRIHLSIIKKIEKKEDVFMTEHKRPKFSCDFRIQPQKSIAKSLTAIVLQGPVLKEHDFTYETVLFYAGNFKDSIIVVSTWVDEDESVLNRLKEAGAVIVLNQKPEAAGISNINYQITTSINGILKAKELGAEYVMKTRTDQRIYGLNVIDYFLNLIQLYPLKNINVQKERLIVPNINTFLYRLYGISDMLMFGNIEDMILYWNADYDKRIIIKENTYGFDIKSFGELRVCEIYLCTEFIKKTGKEIGWNFHSSWDVFANNFCIVDYHSIDLYWPKYFPHNEIRNRYYSANNTHQLLTFSDWVSLYQSFYRLPSDRILTYREGESFYDFNDESSYLYAE